MCLAPEHSQKPQEFLTKIKNDYFSIFSRPIAHYQYLFRHYCTCKAVLHSC